MKLVAFVDLHANMSLFKRLEAVVRKESPDYIVCAGDFTIFEQDMEHMVEKVASLGKVLLINGNHETEEATAVYCKKHNITFIHGKSLDIGGITFVGWGGGGFEEKDEEFEAFVQQINTRNKIVLVTHAPVYGTEVDKMWNEHRGNKSIAEFCKKASVRVAICGHFHENAGKHGKLGKTIVINPGPVGAVIEIEP
ncbi:metallophosphoesterase family protein [Candidatus Woesearchaeota archaeon]|nr:metallophosphoesterase family protein [Candidatus Woesearchaeota archaeon]